MRSSSTISLFSTPPPRDSAPSAFVVSIVVHSVFFLLLFLSMHHVTVVRRMDRRNYMVHLLDVQQSQASAHWYPKHDVIHHSQTAPHHTVSVGGRHTETKLPEMAQLSRNFVTPKPAPQTMIQPEVPPDQRVLPEVPLPQAVVWTASKITQTKVTTPAPKPPAAIPVKPSLEKPNAELQPAEMALSSMPFVTKQPMPIPGTTTPIKTDGPQPAKQIPQTASKVTDQATAARILSMSQQKLDEGTAALPMVNEIAEAAEEGSPMPGKNDGFTVIGGDDNDGGDTGSGAGAGNEKADGVTVDDGSSGGSGEGFTVAGADGAEGEGTLAPPEHITLPRGGTYGMVVVGASPQENYPQTANLWSGRLVYSVYLQTDTEQNWVLQYSLLKGMGDNSVTTRPDPPWVFDMMRPSLTYRNVILVHGFVNAAGRFEQLKIAYPPMLAEAAMLLKALKQWEFRPAMNQGQPATVEVLLIIPGPEE